MGPSLRDEVFAGIRRALRPGGLLLLEGYGQAQLRHGTGGPKVLENLYTPAMLEAGFAGMASLQIREYEAVVEEGAGHSGLSALVDLAAIK